MGFKYYKYAWDAKDITSSELLVLLALADLADNDSGECWPSQDYLANKTRLSPRTVRSALKNLERGGHITRKRKNNAHGRTSDRIRLVVATIAASEAANISAVAATIARNPISYPIREDRESDIRSAEAIRVDQNFNELWDFFPKRPGSNPKAGAARIYRSLVMNDGIDPDLILYAAQQEHDALVDVTDDRFIPSLANWLEGDNYSRYETDYVSFTE